MSLQNNLYDGPASWGEYRKARDVRRIPIKNVDLSYREFIKHDFSDIDFVSCNLRDSDFSGSDFSGATFKDCIFRNTNLSGAKLPRANFLKQKFNDCFFNGILASGIRFDKCEFTDCSLVDAKLMKSVLANSKFSNTDISRCTMDHSDALGATFLRCNLRQTDFGNSRLDYCTFTATNLSQAVLAKCSAEESIWSKCKLDNVRASNINAANARFMNCDFRKAMLDGFVGNGSTLSFCSLMQTNLIKSNLSGAKLQNVRMEYALLCRSDVDGALIKNCTVFGLSTWGTSFVNCHQKQIKISSTDEYSISVSSVEYAHFVYQCMENASFKNLFESTSEKFVLILGRFSGERLRVIDAIREAISRAGLIPIVFDFQKPETHDLSEVILTLALLSRFIVVDLSDPKCSPHEVAMIAPHVRAPISAIVREGESPYAMFDDMVARYSWVFEPVVFDSEADIENLIVTSIIPTCDKYLLDRDAG